MAAPAPIGRDSAPPPPSPLLRAAMWVAIAALVVAALVCVIWVLLGGGDDIVAKAFLTVLLLAGFAGVVILEARLAPRRPEWFVLTSMVTWVVALLIGALYIWMPDGDGFFGATRLFKYVLVVAVLALALLHVRLYLGAQARYVTTFTRVVAGVTVGLVALLALMLIIPLVFGEHVEFEPFYWRLVVSVAILAAVGTALLPLVRALFSPRPPRTPRRARPPQGWPTYADGRTPLPMLADGVPDWNAYESGLPSAAPSTAPVPVAPALAASAPPPPPTAPSRTVTSAPTTVPPVPSPSRVPPVPPVPQGYVRGAARPAGPSDLPPSPSQPSPPAAAEPAPVAARSHGWWGGETPGSDSSEPAMRWADDTGGAPAGPVRRQSGVRRTGA